MLHNGHVRECFIKNHSFQNKPVSPQAAQQLFHFKKKISNVASLQRTLNSKDEQVLNQRPMIMRREQYTTVIQPQPKYPNDMNVSEKQLTFPARGGPVDGRMRRRQTRQEGGAVGSLRRHRAVSLPLGPVVELVPRKSVMTPVPARVSVVQVDWWRGLKIKAEKALGNNCPTTGLIFWWSRHLSRPQFQSLKPETTAFGQLRLPHPSAEGFGESVFVN